MARHWSFVAAVVFASVAMTVGGQQIRAAGYWNMPGNYGQRIGYGFSGGYHAPFLLGPIKCDGWGAPNEIRLRYAPNPCGNCCYGSACGSFTGCGCRVDKPTTLDSNVETRIEPVLAPQPQQQVMTRAPQSLFGPPVQP